MFKKVKIQVAMTRNSNGRPKESSFLWEPSSPCSIPKEGDTLDHGRPLIVLETKDPEDNLVLVLFPDRIVARSKEHGDAVLVGPQSRFTKTGDL